MTAAGSLRALAAGLALATALTGCGHSSPAPASDATGPKAFSYDIAHRKFAGAVFANSDQKKLLTVAQAVCSALDKGRTAAEMAGALLTTKSLTASAKEDGDFVYTAVVTLCPKYVSQIVGAASPTPTAH